jgi:hypothetical protein
MSARIRKAYWIKLYDYDEREVIYGPTPAKAKGQLFYQLSDVWSCTFRQFLGMIESCRRAPECDVHLPDRHPLASQLDLRLIHAVTHACGGTGLKAGYRDHFYTSDDDWVLKAAYYHGLFDRYRADRGRAGRSDMVMYELTTLGKNVARGEVETYP